jgi:predicted acetyltransferase
MDSAVVEIALERAAGSGAERTRLDNLFELYVHDFTDFLAPEQMPVLRENGSFGPHGGMLDRYWDEADRSVWFIRADGALAGFALLNKHGHFDVPIEHNMGEFFVARPFRRHGVGLTATIRLLTDFPGVWEVAIGARNIPAQKFWPKAVRQARISNLQTLQGDGVRWTGPVLRFNAG